MRESTNIDGAILN